MSATKSKPAHGNADWDELEEALLSTGTRAKPGTETASELEGFDDVDRCTVLGPSPRDVDFPPGRLHESVPVSVLSMSAAVMFEESSRIWALHDDFVGSFGGQHWHSES